MLIPPDGTAHDLDGDGRDQVQTEMVDLSLSGNSSLGPVLVHLNPDQPTSGGIGEVNNATPGTRDASPFRPRA